MKKTVLGGISSTQKATLYVSSAVSKQLQQGSSQGQNAEERLYPGRGNHVRLLLSVGLISI